MVAAPRGPERNGQRPEGQGKGGLEVGEKVVLRLWMPWRVEPDSGAGSADHAARGAPGTTGGSTSTESSPPPVLITYF